MKRCIQLGIILILTIGWSCYPSKDLPGTNRTQIIPGENIELRDQLRHQGRNDRRRLRHFKRHGGQKSKHDLRHKGRLNNQIEKIIQTLK